MTDNRTTELRISEPLRGFIRHQSNRAYIDGGQARWLTEIADEIDAKHEQAVDDARIVEVETSYIDIEQGEVITRFVPEQAIAATLGSDKPPYDELLRCLENDWHISASWDGLRKFWCVELTEEGVRMRDAMHGTLTAEQVREAIERNFGKVAVLDDGGPVEWRDDWVCKVGINYKAIADKLNARAERTCRCTTNSDAWCFVCSECGKSFPRSELHLAHNHGEINYCPNCGAKVVSA